MSNSAERVRAWRHRTKTKMVEAMGGRCQCCGYNNCKEALAFHHIDPTKKDIGFSEIRSNPKKWEEIVNELKKCILVCHNCHSEIHAGVRNIPDEYVRFNEEFAEWRIIAEYDNCPACGTEKLAKQKFCSHKCANTNRRKVDWDSVDLLYLLQIHSISELEKMFGVSNAAIYKRRDKILSNQK